jgi:hypothetical protein
LRSFPQEFPKRKKWLLDGVWDKLEAEVLLLSGHSFLVSYTSVWQNKWSY